MLSNKSKEFVETRSQEVLEICSWLAPVLNSVHQTTFSELFWTRVLMSYALAVVNQREFFNRENYDFPVAFEPINGWAPADLKTVIQSRVLTSLRSLRGQYPLSKLSDSIAGTRRLALGVRAEYFAKEVDAKPLSFDWVRYLGLSDRSRRKKVLDLAKALPSLEARNICKGIPKVYIEYFGRILQVLKGLDKLAIEKVFVEHYGSRFDLFLAAYLSEVKGTELVQLQQGGFVGETVISVQPMQRFLYDRLFTYGWGINSKDQPYYAIRLEEYKQKYDEYVDQPRTNDALFVYGAPANSAALEHHYRSSTETIVCNLDAHKFPNIKMRPRATSRVLRRKKLPEIFKRLPKSQVDQGWKNIAELCASSALVVQLTMPSTNFLECIFVDHPVLGVDTNEMPTEIIKPFLHFFHACGVLHKDMESLVSFLNSTDLDAWWAEMIKEPKYLEFKKTFARSREQYLTSVRDAI